MKPKIDKVEIKQNDVAGKPIKSYCNLHLKEICDFYNYPKILIDQENIHTYDNSLEHKIEFNIKIWEKYLK